MTGERVPAGIGSWTPGLAREPRRTRPGGMGMTEEEREALESRNRVGLVGEEPNVLVVPRRALRPMVPARYRGVADGVAPQRTWVGVERPVDEVAGLEDAAWILSAPLPMPWSP